MVLDTRTQSLTWRHQLPCTTETFPHGTRPGPGQETVETNAGLSEDPTRADLSKTVECVQCQVLRGKIHSIHCWLINCRRE